MDLKRTLVRVLPPAAKRALAVPYDLAQTWRADRQFATRDLPSYEPADDAPRHVVCVVVDALRADRVSSDTTPYLASLNGVDAITPGAWTFPAVSSLLSGVYPHEHGATKQVDEPDDSPGISLPPRMGDERETITEALAGAGYRTYGGFGHDTPFVALSGRFHDHALFHKSNSTARDVLDDHLQWVAGRDRTFGFVHLADPHIPVDPPGEYWDAYDVDADIEDIRNWRYKDDVECGQACQRYREHRRRLYRASVDYVDDVLAWYAGRLEEIVEDPLLVVTADHGEALWEHVAFDVEHFDGTGCVDHGGAPYEALARVPLLTNADWDLSSGGLVSLIDIAPTITDAVGIEGPETTGSSLRDGPPEDRLPLVEGSLSGYEKKAVYDGEYKLLVSRGHDVEAGFSLPDEEPTPVPDERRRRMRDALSHWPAGSEETTEVSSVVEDRLDHLGYR